MSRRVGTPMNKVVLSSVNVVRLQRGGGRFEVACYPNKVVDYRSGTETDLDEVLQIRTVFKNVSKGVATPKKDLAKVFPKMSVDDVCREILRSGQLQVSARERGAASEALIRDVAGIVAERVVDAATGAFLPPASVERLLRDEANFARRRRGPRSSRRWTATPSPLALRAEGLADAEPPAVRCVAPPKAYRDVVAAVSAATAGAAAVTVVERAAPPPPPPRPTRRAAAAAAPPVTKVAAPVAPKPRALSCNTCGGSFADKQAHRDHFKSEWHRHNPSLKLEHRPPVDERTFCEEVALAEAAA
ncbi:hypothetical protein JL720_7393 [Aureococcus anophagefferens]|nr:hypothetical protein JL720_7393 [Aureococcus anophagefferens]